MRVQPVEEAVAEARRLYEHGLYADAATLLEPYVRASAPMAAVYSVYALCVQLADEFDMDLVEQCLRRAVALEPSCPMYKLDLAAFLDVWRDEDDTEIEDLLAVAAMRLEEDDIDLIARRALRALCVGQLDVAQQLLDEGLRRYPTSERLLDLRRTEQQLRK